jgi:hypothetical protein
MGRAQSQKNLRHNWKQEMSRAISMPNALFMAGRAQDPVVKDRNDLEGTINVIVPPFRGFHLPGKTAYL